ncbi:MAG TPA: transcription-repair coupling factor [Selenomonas sp.]|nr:transcription-repair coupling factor [Selenomonas sp.]
MHSLLTALRQNPLIRDIKFTGKGHTLVYGMGNAQKHAVIAACYAGQEKPLVILVHNHESLESWREDLMALLPEIEISELPEMDVFEIDATAKSMERSAKRMDIMGRLMLKKPMILLAEATAAIQKGMSRADFERMSIRIELGESFPREELLERLVKLGYENEPEVECMGQFSVRGGILDIFPVNSLAPVRIEFFDDEVDSIRAFDMDTMRSVNNLESTVIFPLAQTSKKGESEPFFSYLGGEGTIIFDDPMRIREQIRSIFKENPEIKKSIFRWEELVEAAEENRVFYTAVLLQQVHHASLTDTIRIAGIHMTPFQRQMDLFGNEAERWLSHKQRVLVLLQDRQKVEQLHDLLARRSIPSSALPEGQEPSEKLLNLQVGSISSGFEMEDSRLVVVTERDIFGHQKKRTMRVESQGNRIRHFREIKPGDYVVHVGHGIGKYVGVETLEVGGVHKDYLHIKYGGNDKLFVPTDQVQMLQKYIGNEGDVPKLHRMGGTEWAKARTRARAAVEDIAKHLIETYARRKKAEGFAFSPDDSTQREFEDSFPYEETEDQLRAVREIKEDMEKAKPMDRLLCGDVGFGKTEVAIRAAYKAVMDDKQVAVLVPTTVLAQQHYQTFSQRFMEFPPNVDVVCRFRTAKEQKATLERVAEGKVDILIGTHAILNQNKVHFKNLGLLIVDEEQRFGVKQKEKIRSLAAGIDVLTLSATPIPRTLHMSLVGARDMSIIETPPAERFPVQSYVVENNDSIIANAIKRELKRGGQVYFIYNRVDTIERMQAHLQELVPEARIHTAHGQMSEDVLERVMMDFYEGTYDILLATSIVENGLDVANANTIIVYNADYFGLSQLYQMRGRVGRSHRMAFAYFVYQADKVLTETAEKRLQAMKEFAELGAGFKIAMRDLEIRGAGNLLGAQQHGHIASVGFEMYCRLLEEAVDALQNKTPIEPKQEPVLSLQVEAYIDGGYVSDAMHKIEIYQRIAAIRTGKQIRDLLDELIDRFGEPSKSVMNLLAIARIKNYARDLGIKNLQEKQDVLEFVWNEKNPPVRERLEQLKKIFGRNFKLLPGIQTFRIMLGPQYKQKVLNLATRVLMLLAGEQVTTVPKRPAK